MYAAEVAEYSQGEDSDFFFFLMIEDKASSFLMSLHLQEISQQI